MNRRKIFLYVSSAIVWVCIVICSFWHDTKNFSTSENYETSESNSIALNEHVSLFGPLTAGETEVNLNYGTSNVKAAVSKNVNEMAAAHSIFPLDDTHMAVSFKEENDLDTLVIFNDKEAQVFYHVIAMSSDTGRIAYLQEVGENGLNLVISTFENQTIKSIELKNHNATFLQEPKIENAIFIGTEFKLDTAIGTFLVSLPSLI